MNSTVIKLIKNENLGMNTLIERCIKKYKVGVFPIQDSEWQDLEIGENSKISLSNLF